VFAGGVAGVTVRALGRARIASRRRIALGDAVGSAASPAGGGGRTAVTGDAPAVKVLERRTALLAPGQDEEESEREERDSTSGHPGTLQHTAQATNRR
jgi:hypothetical protein